MALRLCRITANIGVTGGIIVLVINSWSNNTKNKKKLHESTPNIVARGFNRHLTSEDTLISGHSFKINRMLHWSLFLNMILYSHVSLVHRYI